MTNLAVEQHTEVTKETLELNQLASQLIESLGGDVTNPDERTMTLINQMLNQASVVEQMVSDQKKRIDFLESLSITDDMTGLLNRRGFMDVLRLTLSNARRYHESGLLAYIDLNDFKEVNDVHGHAAGDEVIRKVGSILQKHIRRTDYVARLGGDEFAVLFVRADQVPARARALKVKSALNGAIANYQGVELPISASFGIEPYGPTATSKELLRRADRAMYKEKSLTKSKKAELN